MLVSSTRSLFDFSQREQVSPVLTGIGALYVALLINHTILQPDLRAVPLVLMGSATALLFVASRWLLSHRRLSLATAESLNAALAGAVVIHGLLHLYMLSSFSETRNLVLLALGILAFFLSLRRLALVLLVTLGIWMGVVLWGGASISWLYFAFGLFMASGLKIYSVTHRSHVSEAIVSTSHMEVGFRQMEEQLSHAQTQLTAALESTNEGFWCWRTDRAELETTPQFLQMLGLEKGTLTPDEWLERVRGSHRERLQRLPQSVTPQRPRFEEEFEILHADQQYRWVRVRGIAEFNEKGKVSSLAGWQADITSFKTMQRKLYKRSFRDELTGLSNRQLFLRQTQEALQQTYRKSPEYGVVLMVLDVDRFRRQVDRHGYTAGDQILKALSQRLQSRSGAFSVARLEADRFGLLFAKLPNPLACQRVASSIRQLLSVPFGEGERALRLTASMGLAWGQEGVRPEMLLCRAHHAMRQAKCIGPDRYVVFEEEQENERREQLELELRAVRALEQKELQLVYQPVTNLKSGSIVGVAAQLRWNHPSRGLLFPEQFVEALMASGLEGTVAWWSLREACQRTRGWLAKHPENPVFSVSVPVTARQFSNLGAVDRVFGLLAQFGLSPEALRVEVTEATIDQQPGNVLPMLSELQDGGLEVHLAHFGTCQASPAILERFGFDALKLAPEFMEGIENNQQKQQTVKALLELAQEMAIDVIAEGLDSARQVEIVESFGCENGQGSFFWPAMDQAMLGTILEDSTVRKG